MQAARRPRSGRRLVAYSPPMGAAVRELKDFLYRNMYRHYRVVRMGDKAGRILRDLFESYVGEPLQLPPHVLRGSRDRGLRRSAAIEDDRSSEAGAL